MCTNTLTSVHNVRSVLLILAPIMLDSRLQGPLAALDSRLQKPLAALDSRLQRPLDALDSRLQGPLDAPLYDGAKRKDIYTSTTTQQVIYTKPQKHAWGGLSI